MKRRNGDGSIFQRKDGKWCAELDYTDHRAKRHRARRIRTTERAAKSALEDMKRDHSKRQLTARPRTLSGFLETWLTVDRKPTTNSSYSQVVRDHIDPFLGGRALNDLTVGVLQQWIADLLAAERTPNTVRYARTVLRAALTDAQRLELTSTNAARLVRVPKHTKRKPRHLSPADLYRLLSHSPPWFACWVFVTVTLGLRRGETLGLQWTDCHKETGLIDIARQVYEDGTIGTLKTEGSQRTYLAPPGVWTVLAAHERREFLRWVGKTPPIWIWATSSGGPMLPRNLERTFYRARDLAGLNGYRLHDLRATSIGRLLAAGRPPVDAQSWVGHADVRTTLGYDEMTPDRQLRTSQTMERALPAPTNDESATESAITVRSLTAPCAALHDTPTNTPKVGQNEKPEDNS